MRSKGYDIGLVFTNQCIIQCSSRGELGHPRVHETYFKVNGMFEGNRGVNRYFTVHRKKFNLFF